MITESPIVTRRLLIMGDVGVVAGAYVLSRWIAAGSEAVQTLAEPGVLVLTGALCLIWSGGQWREEVRLCHPATVLLSLWRRWIVVLGVALGMMAIQPAWFPGAVSLTLSGGLGLLGMAVLRLAWLYQLRCGRKSGRCTKKALIVGTGPAARRTVDMLSAHSGSGVDIVGFVSTAPTRKLWSYHDVPSRGSIENLAAIIKSEQIDCVLFCLDDHGLVRTRGAVRLCASMGVSAMVVATPGSNDTARWRAVEFLDQPALTLESSPESAPTTVWKHVLDRVAAASLIVFISPVLIAAAVAVRLFSPGPILFSQRRMGLNGRAFRMFKFRTMGTDAEKLKASLMERNEMSGPVFKISNDPRVTRIGRWLRRTSIDELPQLFNVVRGEMSLVGPRPPLPDEVQKYDDWQRRRLSVRPGLTCLWQVQGRNDIDFEDWMKLDIEYIDNWSMRQDFGILLKTIPAVIRGAGAK